MTREKLEGLFYRRRGRTREELLLGTHGCAQLKDRWHLFNQLIDIGTDEAFLAAAMMCRPEGVNDWRVASRTDPESGKVGGVAMVAHFAADGDTPAEALIAAIEKAMNDA